jgi:predicted ATP-grasp superfamily ATP-dependent carboligase
MAGPWDEPAAHYADIPDAGSAIEAGHPVLTILAEGADEEGCTRELRRRAEEVERMLAGEDIDRPTSGGHFRP